MIPPLPTDSVEERMTQIRRNVGTHITTSEGDFNDILVKTSLLEQEENGNRKDIGSEVFREEPRGTWHNWHKLVGQIGVFVEEEINGYQLNQERQPMESKKSEKILLQKN